MILRGIPCRSVDVIVIEKEHEKTRYYVDSFGFTKVADFLEEKKISLGRDRNRRKSASGKRQSSIFDRSRDDRRSYRRRGSGYIQMKIREYHLPIQIREVMVYGSRSRGTENADSDLDILFEYAGARRRMIFFNLLHEDDFCIGEVKSISIRLQKNNPATYPNG